MEALFKTQFNGQSVLTGDFDVLGDGAAYADDRVFAEMFRMRPYNGSSPARGILPYYYDDSGEAGLIAANGGTGSVLVYPFRGFVGSTVAVATDGKRNWRDIRSQIAAGTSTLAQTVSLSANASGNPRWDLIYAAVTPDTPSAMTTHKVKDPTSKVITDQSLVRSWITTVTLGVVEGTAAASPDWPATPADGSATYYIPLAYIRVPDGFTAASTVAATDIATVAPVLSLSEATSGGSLGFASCHRTLGGGTLTAAQIQTWGATGTRPNMFVPSTAAGTRSLIIALDLQTGTESHVDGAVLDERDWRGRLCRFMVHLGAFGTTDLAWDGQGAKTLYSPHPTLDPFKVATITGNGVYMGMSQTLRENSGIDPTWAAYVDGTNGSSRANQAIGVYCDFADGGKLKLSLPGGSPNARVIFWLEFTGRLENT
jgi:hypothetical protein